MTTELYVTPETHVFEAPAQTRLQRPRRQAAGADDFFIALAPPAPRIRPGVYQAVSESVHRRRLWGRYYLEITFKVFEGDFADSVVLARVQGFFRLGDGKTPPRPSSKVARMIRLIDPTLRGIQANALRDKLWKVEVVDVALDRDGKELSEANKYSRVVKVLERLA